MRKFLIPLLLGCAAATPALAAPEDSGWQAMRAGRDDSRGERRQAAEHRRSENAGTSDSGSTDSNAASSSSNNRRMFVRERSAGPAQSAGIVSNQPAMMRPPGGEGVSADAPGPGRMRFGHSGQIQQGTSEGEPANVQARNEGSSERVTNWRRHERRLGQVETTGSGSDSDSQAPLAASPAWRHVPATSGSGDFRQSDRPVPRVFRNRVPVVSSEPREGSQPPVIARPRRAAETNWSTHWRRDNRYDWTRWRDRHRSRFHLAFYYDPFGWNYRPYSIGWRLWPSYYSSRYWLHDPSYYRLPYAPPGYRWIRYYDDAILVDTWDGTVVDVIYNFFW